MIKNQEISWFNGNVKVLSLAVLFKVDKSDIFELEKKIISERFDDYLVNFWIKKIDSTWERKEETFEFKVYDCLKQILEKDREMACEELKEYLLSKKKMSPIKVMLLLVVVAFIGVFVGFFNPGLSY